MRLFSVYEAFDQIVVLLVDHRSDFGSDGGNQAPRL